MKTPYYIQSSSTAIEIGWSGPSYQGGCAVLSYSLLMDHAYDTFVEVATEGVNTDSYAFDMSGETPGLIYKFKVRAYNANNDFAQTNALSVALAS